MCYAFTDRYQKQIFLSHICTVLELICIKITLMTSVVILKSIPVLYLEENFFNLSQFMSFIKYIRNLLNIYQNIIWTIWTKILNNKNKNEESSFFTILEFNSFSTANKAHVCLQNKFGFICTYMITSESCLSYHIYFLSKNLERG